MVLFPPGKGGGEGVAYGGKGKGVLIHTLTEGNGMPLANCTTAANGSEREQIIPLLDKVKIERVWEYIKYRLRSQWFINLDDVKDKVARILLFPISEYHYLFGWLGIFYYRFISLTTFENWYNFSTSRGFGQTLYLQSASLLSFLGNERENFRFAVDVSSAASTGADRRRQRRLEGVSLRLTLVWRQVPSVRELNRMLARENLLWAKATCVSQQALSQRLLTFPASMFERVSSELLVTLNQRWSQRKKRPLPKSVAHANQYFEQLWIVDASNPLRGFASEAVGELQFAEALFRKLKSLEGSNLGKLGGRICPKGYRFAYAVVDLMTRYPVQTWFNEHPYAHESNFVPQLIELTPPKTLLLLDRGFWNFSLFEQLILAQSEFITRLKTNAKYKSLSICLRVLLDN